MDNNPEKPLWEPDSEFPQLRRPRVNLQDAEATNTTNNNSSMLNDNNDDVSVNSDVAERSTLSVEAEEWYPPGYNNQASLTQPTAPIPSTVQGRLNKYRQQNSQQGQQQQNGGDAYLDYLTEMIRLLTLKPGKFDDVICSLLSYLEPYFQDYTTMSDVTTLIFRQAINESNFQYTGARLFAILDEQCPFVRACLHSDCEKELEKISNSNNSNSLQSLTLFYAEIYSQLNFELFGKCLLKALEKLAAKPENVKYVCQTLKLAGAKLEELDKALITDILNRLESNSALMTQNMAFLVQSVIKLRDSNWGREQQQQQQPPPRPPSPPKEPEFNPEIDLEPVEDEWQDGPVFYGPDGMQLTAEENDFLRENLSDDCVNDDGNPDALWDPEPEMNEEIQAAFADFVRSTYR